MKTEYYVYRYVGGEWVDSGIFKRREKALEEAQKHDQAKIIKTVSTVIL